MKTIITHLQKYYGVYLLIIAVLFLILWFPNRILNRYAIAPYGESGVWILDTRTGQVYYKSAIGVINFGTVDKPIVKVVKYDPNN